MVMMDMTNKYGDKYRVHNLVKFSYSEIGEYIDENHTDKPLRNDEIIDLLNKQNKRITELEKENKELLQDNNHKFWKHQFMQQQKQLSFILDELSTRAIDGRYFITDEFEEYMDEIREKNNKVMEKALEQEKE